MCDSPNGHHSTSDCSETVATTRVPLIGELAPAFEAVTTQGHIHFPRDFEGRWVILFSHPADFTPVCTTEFMAFANLLPQFDAINCQLLGLSIDSNYSHIAWLRTIKERIKYKGMENVEVTFPVIADLKMDVARKYGMVQPWADDSHAVRAVFIIDPDAKIRAVLYYPISTGRNFPEILRMLVALQTADKLGVATPADWQPGDDVIVPAPGSCGTAQDRVEGKEEGMTCLDWFLCLKKAPKSQLNLPPMWR
ncbi:MAG: peroxiredoxin [Pirellulales bacterium]|nr:peroxiredoxin [Pirellulales bacterium]